MKIEFLALSALAASAAAIPIRIITLSGPVPHLAPSEVSHSIKAGEVRIMPHAHAPCHGGKKGMGMGGSFGDLLTRLGFVRPHEHGHGNGNEHQYEYGHGHHADHAKGNEWQVVKAWRNHVEEVGSRIIPIMEGGAVRVLDLTEGDKNMENKHGQAVAHAHGHGHGHLRGHGGHDWHQASFAGRLHRAISSLTPTEATIFAFVIGAGIGSIFHLIFMLFLISVRRMRGLKCKSREERREARRARREARVDKITKAITSRLGGGDGAVRSEGGDGEVLPAYGEGEGDRLVEKA